MIKQVLVTAEVPVHGFTPFPEETVTQTASFYVNTDTWECNGEVAGHPVMVDEEWWKDQCQRIANRVREGLSTLTV